MITPIARIACSICQSVHPSYTTGWLQLQNPRGSLIAGLSSLDSWPSQGRRGAGAQDGFFGIFFTVSSFGTPTPSRQKRSNMAGHPHRTGSAEDLAQARHDQLSITQFWGTITVPLRVMFRTARASLYPSKRGLLASRAPAEVSASGLERTDFGTNFFEPYSLKTLSTLIRQFKEILTNYWGFPP